MTPPTLQPPEAPPKASGRGLARGVKTKRPAPVRGGGVASLTAVLAAAATAAKRSRMAE